jgi:UDP-N-acetylglucosamine diphosphorylase/glucosamine-1-phosphate N-acetyltransferase
MNLILFDDSSRVNLLPFTFTRPCSEIRTGMLSITEKWERSLGTKASFLTESYLQAKFPLKEEDDNLLINGTVIPDAVLIEEISSLSEGVSLYYGELLLASRVNRDNLKRFNHSAPAEHNSLQTKSGEFLRISAPYHIFSLNDKTLRRDFELLTKGRKSAKISETNTVIASENVFLEEGAIVECSIINASSGPVYISKDAEVMEGCMIRGGLYLGEHAALKMGAKIYGPTTIGPHCKVGGEVNNSVIFGYSNKAHDGFLGNSVIGEWCNLGADTNNSNLKNNYAEVKLWDYQAGGFKPTGLQFCGLMLGDHSKCGINTMFNTGTVVGVAANVFGDGFPRNFIPSFSWGGANGFTTYQLNKVFETESLVYKRRGLELDQIERELLNNVFELTAQYRFWEKSKA